MWINRLIYDVRALFSRRSLDQRIEIEMQYHLEREAHLHIKEGAPPVEARRIAAARFGGATQMREAALDVGGLAFLDSLWRDLRFGARSLRKRPVFTAAVVATLALGIGATTTIFTAVNAVLLRPLPFRDPGQLVAIWEHDRKSGQRGADHEEIAPANLADWLRDSRTLAGASTYGIQRLALVTNDGAEEFSASAVSWSHFALLGVRPLLGRTFMPSDSEPGGEPVVVISESLWQRRFGADSGLVGRSISVGGSNRTVRGIVPAAAAFPKGVELWVPRTPTASQLGVRSSHYLRVIARLRPGADVDDARQELAAISKRLEADFPQSNADRGVNVVPLQVDQAGSVRLPLLMLFGAVAFVMLVACANVGGLFMARSAARASELALRLALGAGRRRIVQQLLAECMLLSVSGAAIGLLAAAWGTQILMQASPVEVVQAGGAFALDGRAIAFAVGLAILAGIVFGVAPALAASGPDLHHALKQGGRQQATGSREARGRRLLVVGELALTMILLVGAGLMVRSLIRLQEVDLGFGSSRLLTAEVRLPGSRYPGGTAKSEVFFQQVLQEMKRDPDVEAASAVFMLPFTNDNRIYAFRRVEYAVDADARANFRVALPGYFDVIKVPLLRGRDFAVTDTAGGPRVVVINHTMARRYWFGDNALGKRIVIRAQSEPAEIVGIVGDMRYFGHDASPAPEMYVPHAQVPMNDMTVVLRTRGDPAALTGMIARAVHALDAQVPLGRVSTMTQLVDESLAVRRFTRMLLAGFSLVGLLLSSIGIYGLVAYSVAQRTTEIGIRIALGATAANVLALVAGSGVRLALTGLAVGAAGSLMLGRALGTLVFGIGITDPVVLVASAVVLLAVALGATLIPAFKAARLNPVIAFRSS